MKFFNNFSHSIKVNARTSLLHAVEQRKIAGLPILLNLGCGSRYHSAWINIDLNSQSELVFAWNLGRGIPVPDNTCDAIYSSHTIEHFDRKAARRLLEECGRALRPGGTLRLATPDLERVAGTYLSCLKAARAGEPGAASHYDWIIIEMLDQMVRHEQGGEMLRYWSQEHVPAEHFVAERVGTEYWGSRQHCKGRIYRELHPEAERVGKFRLSGEAHLWMYDSYSLGRVLTEIGLANVKTHEAIASNIFSFKDYNLDTDPNGVVFKPDSFFIEAQKL